MKKGICIAALAAAAGLVGCGGGGETAENSSLARLGYVAADDAIIQAMPKQPITAVMSDMPDWRISVLVNSPFACVNLARTFAKTSTVGTVSDDNTSCVAIDGTIPVVVRDGQAFVLLKILPQ